MRSFKKSQDWLGKASYRTPGASQTRSKAPGHLRPLDGFPLVLGHGWGPHVWDVDGNRYLDLICSLAAVPLGHGHPKVTSAVIGAVAQGNLLSLPTALEQEVSERLCQTMGCEQVRWVKTGSEAVSAAVKLARSKTGRVPVAVGEWAYHGWHQWFSNSQGAVYTYKHNDLESVEFLARTTGLAAILYEPHRQEAPTEEFLVGLREIADREGCALIYDEMVYGFRWDVRGGAGFYDTGSYRPDMQTFGKGLGNGQAVACVCGAESWLREADTLVSSTYGGDRVGLAAANAVLKLYESNPVISTLWKVGESLQEGWNLIPDAPVLLEGFPVHPRPVYDQAFDYPQFQREMANRGVLIHDANFNVNTALEDYVGDVLAAAQASFAGLTSDDIAF